MKLCGQALRVLGVGDGGPQALSARQSVVPFLHVQLKLNLDPGVHLRHLRHKATSLPAGYIALGANIESGITHESQHHVCAAHGSFRVNAQSLRCRLLPKTPKLFIILPRKIPPIHTSLLLRSHTSCNQELPVLGSLITTYRVTLRSTCGCQQCEVRDSPRKQIGYENVQIMPKIQRGRATLGHA